MDTTNYDTITQEDKKFMQLACDLAYENIDNGGGPFGAVIVRDGKVLSTGTNTVTIDNDPTAHAEVNAIRNACRQTSNFKLEDCIVYTSCEPCPMCLSALYWAGVKKIYYGNTQLDAKKINFDDNFIYQEIAKPQIARSIPCIHMADTDAIRAFEKWETKTDKTEY